MQGMCKSGWQHSHSPNLIPTHTHTMTQIDDCYGNPKGGGMHLCFAGFLMQFIQLEKRREIQADLTWVHVIQFLWRAGRKSEPLVFFNVQIDLLVIKKSLASARIFHAFESSLNYLIDQIFNEILSEFIIVPFKYILKSIFLSCQGWVKGWGEDSKWAFLLIKIK